MFPTKRGSLNSREKKEAGDENPNQLDPFHKLPSHKGARGATVGAEGGKVLSTFEGREVERETRDRI